MDGLPGFSQKFNEVLEEREVQLIGSMKPNLKAHQIIFLKSIIKHFNHYIMKIKQIFISSEIKSLRTEDHYKKEEKKNITKLFSCQKLSEFSFQQGH